MNKNLPEEKKPQSVEEQLSAILEYLHRAERRERIRMTGATIRSLLALIPLIFTLYFAWYFYNHGAEFIQDITEQTMKNSINFFGGE